LTAALSDLRLLNLAREAWQRWSGPASARRDVLSEEVEALLDYRGGLAHYHRDDAWRRGVVEHFRFTLGEMVGQAQASGVPVLLVDPVCNLKDCPPFKTELDHGLSELERQRVQSELATLSQQTLTPEQSMETLQAVLQLTPRHAGAWFLLGQAHLAAGDTQVASNAFVRAKEEDICPLRIIEPIRDAIAEVGAATASPVIPVRRHFEEHSPQGIPGDELLLDHVHPSITGHQMVAELLLESMARQNWLTFASGWKERQKQRYQEHLATLDTPYYARGQEHLDGLRKWTQGRVMKLRGSAK
jgi:hypothetical protein